MTNPSFCTLNSRTIIEITGTQATDFLQGLITNDISKADPGHALYAALLTPQGKILFDFFISQPRPGTYWLECSRNQAADLAKRLTFYKLRADVSITPLSDDLKVTCIWGAGAQATLDGYHYADPRTPSAGLRMISPAEAISITGNRVDTDTYTAHRVHLGLGDSDGDIGSSERFVHECNLDMLNGVDFSKGCYVGQEVVSRMHHKQAARKRILPVSSTDTLTTGAAIMTDGKSIGEILTSTGPQALAVLRLDKADAALAAGTDLTVENTPLTLIRPEWAKFPFPGEVSNE